MEFVKICKPPAFQIYVGDFITGTAHMTAEEVGGYFLLLLYQWNHNCIPFDEKKLKIISRCSKKSLKNILEKFEEINGKLINKRLEEERKKQEIFREKQAQNGKNGGRPSLKNKETQKNPGLYFGLTQTEPNTKAKKSSSSSIEEYIYIKEKKYIQKKEKFDFEEIWKNYPRRIGRKEAERHFNASVKTEEAFAAIQHSLIQYRAYLEESGSFIQNGRTWFNNWTDWNIDDNTLREMIDNFKSSWPKSNSEKTMDTLRVILKNRGESNEEGTVFDPVRAISRFEEPLLIAGTSTHLLPSDRES